MYLVHRSSHTTYEIRLITQAMFTLYRIDFRSSSEIDPIQCERCSGNWTGPELSCSHRTRSICSMFVLVWQKKPSLESKSDDEIPSQKRGDALNSPFTSGAKRSKTLSDTEHITFRIGVFQVIIIKNRWIKCEQKACPLRFSERSDDRLDIVWTWPKPHFLRHTIAVSLPCQTNSVYCIQMKNNRMYLVRHNSNTRYEIRLTAQKSSFCRTVLHVAVLLVRLFGCYNLKISWYRAATRRVSTS